MVPKYFSFLLKSKDMHVSLNRDSNVDVVKYVRRIKYKD